MNITFPPWSLRTRLFVLLLGCVLIAVFITTALALYERERIVTNIREHDIVKRIADFLYVLNEFQPQQRADIMHALPSGYWHLAPSTITTESSLPLVSALVAVTKPAIAIEAAWRIHNRELECIGIEECSPSHGIGVQVRFTDGQKLIIEKRHGPVSSFRLAGVEFLISLAILSSLLAVVVWFAVRLVLQPLHCLSEAAKALGHDPEHEHPPMDESGPIEVCQAAKIFNEMRKRLRAHIEERTRILAAITHDLKTPLTRMRLRLEQCEDEQLRVRLDEDVAAMQRLVTEGLELARSLDSSQLARTVDLGALLQSICDDAVDSGGKVYFTGPEGALVTGRPDALRRGFFNLIDNAEKYAGEVWVQLEHTDTGWLVHVMDSGPGIPECHLNDVMQPFFRLESSRSRETGGTGLGLSIAHNLLTTQGNKLSLHNRPEGGLEARVHLPFAPSSS